MSSIVLRRARALAAAGGAVFLTAAAGCGTGVTAPDQVTPIAAPPRALSAAEQRAVSAGNAFSIDLFREVSRRKADSNVVISPLSASIALGMTANGAAGETRAGILRALRTDARDLTELNQAYRDLAQYLLGIDRSVQLGIANAIFHRNDFPFTDAFFQTTRQWFDAEVRALDFRDEAGTLRAVNGWASTKTNGRIDRVLTQVHPRDVMYLMNAVYFKARWVARFDPAETRLASFAVRGGAPASVPTMTRSETRMRGAFVGSPQAGVVQVGELAYGNSAYVMTIVLPPRGTSVERFVAELTPARWDSLVGALRDAEQMVALPRFTLRYEDTWNDVLTTMGMGLAFAEGRADFTGLSPRGRDLFLAFVKQNVFIQVDEEGTEAAAVTTVGVRVTSAPPSLIVDRPFVLAIRERFSGAILFIGKVVDPRG